MPSELHAGAVDRASNSSQEPAIELSVVVPVYNQAGSIVHNVGVIRDRVAAGVGAPIEVIVVSDGSIDSTEERLLASELPDVRVLHYDRNLGKGYAVKTGTLAARGRWIGFVDADLDIDPAGLAEYMRVAQADELDFAIASKRHPDSQVVYPRSRRVASWLFQQLVRVLFSLDVRDTQVGLKVFRREVADQVFPLLLVKRYAFDIEMLAVARALGFSRVRELPVRIDYQFTGSGVRPGAVLIALIDTLAVFYRLRILRTYQRKRELLGAYAVGRDQAQAPHVTLIAADAGAAAGLDWPDLDVVVAVSAEERAAAVAAAKGELLAFVEPGATPSGNFISAGVAFLAHSSVAAVVTSKMAPVDGSDRERAAAAVRESRLGGGSLYYRFMPGNVRAVQEFPTASYIVRRDRLRAVPPGLAPDRVPEALARAGGLVIYTPEAFLVEVPAPLFGPHLATTYRYGRTRARGRLRPSTAVAIATLLVLSIGWLFSFWLWLAVLALYLLIVLTGAFLAAVQFRSLRVGALAGVTFPPTHLAYLAGYARGVVRG